MKILFVCQYFYPEVFRGNDIAFHWAEEGHDVHVVCGVPNYPDGVFHKGYGWFKRRHEVVNGVKVTRLPIIPRGNNKIMLMLNYFSYLFVAWVYMLLHAIFHKYDRVFVQQLSPVMMSAPGVLYKKLRHVPLYTWVLDLWPESLTAALLDAEQVMSDGEQKYKNDVKIQAATVGHSYALTSNIRTNADVYSFVKALFDTHHSASQNCREHIEITYCQTEAEASEMLVALQKKGYHVPKFTPILHGKADYEDWFPANEPSAHEVIGQEFDDVVGLISDKMYYNVNGELVSHGRYLYREDRMLYQILSRARHKIHLVILNNSAILERCLRLMGC